MRNLVYLLAAVLTTITVFGPPEAASQAVGSPPLSEAVKVPAAAFKDTAEITLPVITWGGDIATIFANGSGAVTTKDGIFGKRGLRFKLVRMDDFKNQVEMFIKGETPYLRGTMGMINMATEALSKDPRTKPVVVYQMTWSAGGDCLVVKEGINTVKDLKGKTIAVQAYGPHVDYMTTLLKDAGLSTKDVKIWWTKDLTGTKNTPGDAFGLPGVEAAFCIIPDGMSLTSGGTVGTGSEGSVKGAKILVSTKTANRIISDVYAVRSDYFEKHRDRVQALVHGLLLAEQEIRGLFRDRKSRTQEFKKVITSVAEILLDSPQATADAEALYADCEFVGFQGNVKFFGDPNWPRNFGNLTDSIQSALVSIGLLGRKSALEHAKWNYDQFRSGLAGVDSVETPKFKAEELARVVEKKRAAGELRSGELFSFDIYFRPNQNDFPTEMYSDDFQKVVELASTYGGAVIIVEGHADPMGYLRRKKERATDLELKRMQQAARNLSLTRALRVRDSIMDYGKGKGVSLDNSQFTVIGQGIMQPKTGMCGSEPCPPKSEDEWLSNMRVAFRIIQLEAEESVFKPLE